MSYIPAITQSWTISANNRARYTSVLAMMGSVMYSLKEFLKTTMGFTVKGSNSTTGGAMDGVDRISSAAAWATRNNGAGGNQSWIVLTDGQGVDWCFSYNSSLDDVVRLAHSTGGNYVAAGTPSQQPTATDECFDSQSGTWVATTTATSRVWHMQATSDKKQWRLVVLGVAVFISYIGGERFNSALQGAATFTLGVGGGTVGVIKSYYNTQNMLSIFSSPVYGANSQGDLFKVHANGADQIVGASVAQIVPKTTATFLEERGTLQGEAGHYMFQWALLSSFNSAPDGILGNKIDHWGVYTNSTTFPFLGDPYGNLEMMGFLPYNVLPWDKSTIAVWL